MYILYLSNDECLDMIQELEDYDPCYIGKPHNCDNCGECLN